MIVAQDGSGDFLSLQAALNSLSKENTTPIHIFIRPGIYKEKIHIEIPFLTLIGENPETTILTYDDYALKTFPNGTTYGTFNSYSFFVGTHDFTAYNLTIQNTAGPGKKVGQALAVYADGDRIHFKNCRLLANQDTLFLGPLPPAPIEAGSFRGPREQAPRINGRHYYESCFIRGDIDFIFGSATAFFKDCEIFSNNLHQEINGYITAASTPEAQKYGFIFETCNLTSNCPKASVYLGRPWRHYAKTVFIDCQMGDHIIKEGWHDWDKTDSHSTTFFGEIGTRTSAPIQRVSWSHSLCASDKSSFSREAVLKGTDNWQPWLT
ncbi:pectin methylesterase [Sporanaerobium hydrogeniformans]|uniref:Pectin methylesterase n=1 Tax=Sporanaerobium hydrogeniformans TaxID=3072179 RepID=A0AC61DDZ9_9FIRM|nr:pectinesterase family protein [Sporanaerobium hydrogeniformans]PHV70961.1 pectin methylesterase [Sporanaerobium hydrogeniformans]